MKWKTDSFECWCGIDCAYAEQKGIGMVRRRMVHESMCSTRGSDGPKEARPELYVTMGDVPLCHALPHLPVRCMYLSGDKASRTQLACIVQHVASKPANRLRSLHKGDIFYFYSHSLTSPITSRIVMAPMLARQRRSGESRGRRRQQAQRASGWTNEASGRLSARSWLSCQCVCARMGVRLWCCGLCWQWAIMARMT